MFSRGEEREWHEMGQKRKKKQNKLMKIKGIFTKLFQIVPKTSKQL